MGQDNKVTIEAEQAALDVMLAMRQFDVTEDIETLWGLFVDYAHNLGADLISYHHFKADFAPGHKNEYFHVDGFPARWVEKYFNNNYINVDPIIMQAKISSRPFRWLAINSLTSLTGEQKNFMNNLRSWMKGDGYGVPVFGPSGRNGYFGVGSTTGLDGWAIRSDSYLHMACESFHVRYCELRLLSLEQDFTLTPREMLILENMALGRSDALICGLIGAQINSVESGIRRILKKMGVSDRSAAILRGVGCGLLDPSLVEART